ncbi:MAG: dTMP kinase [Treponema sp.]|nr:dTMP kinase [Treponema sp.]
MTLKKFVVFEGIDGAGTSTQIEMLKKNPLAKNFFFTAEPSEGATGLFLREILAGKAEVSPETAAYLFAADRAEHLWGKGGISEQVEGGKIVVCDRYIFSSLAYQGTTCGEILPKTINSPFPLPEILFFFEISAEDSMARIEKRGERREIYEKREMLAKTAERYRKVISEYKSQNEMKIVELDASLPKEKIAEQIWHCLEPLL